MRTGKMSNIEFFWWISVNAYWHLIALTVWFVGVNQPESSVISVYSQTMMQANSDWACCNLIHLLDFLSPFPAADTSGAYVSISQHPLLLTFFLMFPYWLGCSLGRGRSHTLCSHISISPLILFSPDSPALPTGEVMQRGSLAHQLNASLIVLWLSEW